MSNETKIMCPLCMEEMDLTDLQLKPCECGYEICLWCWHHILEIAQKDGTEGQCPACRNPYDKERIMTMTISSERKISSKKKHKIQKDKPKAPELTKDLENVRVIVRNLVYMAGIPTKLANEETLCKKEYLGQYGKILKVFITRPSEVHHQSFPDSCIVYITFSKKEEALQCIQSVNGFILDGYPLKACFGTTRYCHIWLKNLSCKNPNCFFIHGTVSQEDICTKEEVASACTSKVQQYSGSALDSFQQCPSHKNIQRRSGSTLPAPEGNYQSCAEKTLAPSVTPKPFSCDKNSRSDGTTSSALSGAFPCGSMMTSGKASYASVAVSQGRLNTSDMFNGLVTPSSGVEAQSLEETQSNKQILTSGSHTKPLNGFEENCGYSVKAVPNFKANLGNNIEAKDIVADSSRHASYQSLCSATGGSTDYPERLNRTVREPLITSRQDSLVANLRAMNIDYVDASQKVPCGYNWSSGCSELVKSADRFEAKDHLWEFEGLPICDTGAKTGKQLNKFSAYSDGGNGVYVRDEQEVLHNKFSAFDSKDSGNKDVQHRFEHLSSLAENMVKHVDIREMIEEGSFSEKFSMDSKNPSANLANHLMYPKNLTLSNDTSSSQSFDDSTTEASSEPRYLPRLHKPASSGSRSAVLAAPKIPPGFYPKRTADRGQSCSRPSTSGTLSPSTSSNYSFFISQPIDSIKRVFGGETPKPNNRLPLQLKAVVSDNSLFPIDQSNYNSINYNYTSIPRDPLVDNSQFNGHNDLKFRTPNSWCQ